MNGRIDDEFMEFRIANTFTEQARQGERQEFLVGAGQGPR
jgi:hypothetical protein